MNALLVLSLNGVLIDAVFSPCLTFHHEGVFSSENFQLL